MKKSEITVTMPITTYEELISYRDNYIRFIKEFKNCYENAYDSVIFNGEKFEKRINEIIEKK